MELPCLPCPTEALYFSRTKADLHHHKGKEGLGGLRLPSLNNFLHQKDQQQHSPRHACSSSNNYDCLHHGPSKIQPLKSEKKQQQQHQQHQQQEVLIARACHDHIFVGGDAQKGWPILSSKASGSTYLLLDHLNPAGGDNQFKGFGIMSGKLPVQIILAAPLRKVRGPHAEGAYVAHPTSRVIIKVRSRPLRDAYFFHSPHCRCLCLSCYLPPHSGPE